MSLNTRESTWWAPGRPLAVGGPSQNTHGSAPSRRRIDSAKTSRSRQRSRTSTSRAGNDCWGSTRRRGICRVIVGSATTVNPATFRASMAWRILLLALIALAIAPGGAAAASWSAPQALTRAGDAFSPALANGTNGGVAVAYTRALGSVQRVELRNGTLRGTLRAPVVLDSSSHAVFGPAVTI